MSTETESILSETRFTSIQELKNAHLDLRARFRDGSIDRREDLPRLLRQFVRKGVATGALLDNEADRNVAQTILDYWLPELLDLEETDWDEEATLEEFDPSLAPELPDEDCPYVGLDEFREGDAERFYGRGELVNQLLAVLQRTGVLLIVGPSGSGKSSLAKAGLIPALKAGRIPESGKWRYLNPMVPGATPNENLRRTLNDENVGAPEAGTTPAVVLIDQFEELFTLCRNDEKRGRFCEKLVELADSGRHRIILTMRLEFEPHLTKYPSFYEKVRENQVRVTPLTAAELREAIEAPARRVGLKFEEGVVEQLLEEVLGEPAGLPLLQFSLLKLWNHRERNRITKSTYDEVGGGSRALARAADHYFDGLIKEDQDCLRRMMLELVEPTQGVEVLRRRIPVQTLFELGDTEERVNRLLGQLKEQRLIRVHDPEGSGITQVEVVHEALIRNWPRFVDWIDDRRHYLRKRREISDAARAWSERRDDAYLFRGEQLERAQSLRNQGGHLGNLEEQFLEASAKLAKAEVAKAEMTRRVFKILAMASLILALAAGTAAVKAWVERARTEQQRSIAEQQRTIAEQKAAEAENQYRNAQEAWKGSDGQLLQMQQEVNRQTSEAERAVAEANELKAKNAWIRAELTRVAEDAGDPRAARIATSLLRRLDAVDAGTASIDVTMSKVTRVLVNPAEGSRVNTIAASLAEKLRAKEYPVEMAAAGASESYPDISSVDYFHEEDLPVAQELVGMLAELGVSNLDVNPRRLKEEQERGVFRVWIVPWGTAGGWVKFGLWAPKASNWEERVLAYVDDDSPSRKPQRDDVVRAMTDINIRENYPRPVKGETLQYEKVVGILSENEFVKVIETAWVRDDCWVSVRRLRSSEFRSIETQDHAKIEELVDGMVSLDYNRRVASTRALVDFYKDSDEALRLVLDQLNPGNVEELDPSPRVNVLLYLNATPREIWTRNPALLEEARASIDWIREHRTGLKGGLGRQVTNLLLEFEKKIGT